MINNLSPDKLSPKDRFDYAMKHFCMVADQRVKTFNFYVIASAAAATASVAVATRPDIPRVTFCVIGTAHIFIAFVFWLIDFRGCSILSISSDALADLEKTYIDGISERQINEDRRQNKQGFRKLISYRTCFFLIFLVHALFGALFAWHPSWLLASNQLNKPVAQETRQVK